MKASTQITVLVLVASVCLTQLANAAYIDCSMECFFAKYREPTLCECKNTMKLHWGKRTPRTRSYTLPTFRYGKRATPFNQGYFNDENDIDRLNTLRSIQEAMEYDS